jgi:hypothetical protein
MESETQRSRLANLKSRCMQWSANAKLCYKRWQYRLKLLHDFIKRSFTKTDYLWICLTILNLVILWSVDITLDNSFIPSIVNGATATTSLMMAFTGILFSIGYSQGLDIKKVKLRLDFTLFIFSFSLIQICSAYLAFVGEANFINAFRFSITGLVLSAGAVATFFHSWSSLR